MNPCPLHLTTLILSHPIRHSHLIFLCLLFPSQTRTETLACPLLSSLHYVHSIKEWGSDHHHLILPPSSISSFSYSPNSSSFSLLRPFIRLLNWVQSCLGKFGASLLSASASLYLSLSLFHLDKCTVCIKRTRMEVRPPRLPSEVRREEIG